MVVNLISTKPTKENTMTKTYDELRVKLNKLRIDIGKLALEEEVLKGKLKRLKQKERANLD